MRAHIMTMSSLRFSNKVNCEHIIMTLWYYLTTLTKLAHHTEEKIYCTSHNALLPIGYFVQVVMWGDSDETVLKCKIGMSFIN